MAANAAREQELAEKYNLVPIFMEDKVDGSDVAAVEWAAVVPVLESLTAELATTRRLQGQANYLLANVVRVANISAIEGSDGFIERYDMPVGPIHKAIPFLADQGIVVTLDGRILNAPADSIKRPEADR